MQRELMFRIVPSRHCKNSLLNLQRKITLCWYIISINFVPIHRTLVHYLTMYLDPPNHTSSHIQTLQGFLASRNAVFIFVSLDSRFCKFGRSSGCRSGQERTWKLCQEVKSSGFEEISRQDLGSSGLEGLVIWSCKTEGGFQRPAVYEIDLIMMPQMRVL